MRHQARLQDAIRDRYDRLADTDAETIDHQIALTRDWINGQPELRAILAEADTAEPGMDFPTWRSNMLDRENAFVWPSRTEAGRAWLVWQLMAAIAAGCSSGGATYQTRDYSVRFRVPFMPPDVKGQNDLVVTRFVKQVFRPFFHYLIDQVEYGSTVIHTLQRYKARVEWFDQDSLYARYEENTRNGEEVYNLDLQRFLLLDGGYITQAKARSASGEADLIGGLETDDPLICEGKLYKGDSAYLANGFHQVIKYAHDYNKTVAHLIVFNLTPKLLQVQTDGPAGAWAPFVEAAGVRVHLIAVRALPPSTTASKSGKATTVVIRRNNLTTLDEEASRGTPDHEAPTDSGI
jgi:hypothetical protein